MQGIQNLERIAEVVGTISMDTQDRPTSWRGQQASLAFAKLGVSCMTFLRLIPGSRYFGPVQQIAIWDLTAVAGQCRNIIEAYHLLLYLVSEPANDDEREFRQALWDYHEQYERREMLRSGVPDSKNLPKIEVELQRRKVRLEASIKFRGLSAPYREQLLKGKDFKLESAIELSRKAGISEYYYRSRYKYCSAFAHSAPFALRQLDEFEAGTPAAQDLLRNLVDTTLAYCLFAIRDFISLFPDQTAELKPWVWNGIRFWEDILKWEKSPYFSGQMPPP